jgi:hypothetical protein
MCRCGLDPIGSTSTSLKVRDQFHILKNKIKLFVGYGIYRIFSLVQYPEQNTMFQKLHLFLKSPILWDITPCSPLKVNWSFGRLCCLRLQVRRISQASNERENIWQVSPKSGLSFNGLHGVISQEIELFNTTAVRTSNPTENCSHSQVKRRDSLVTGLTFPPKMEIEATSKVCSSVLNAERWTAFRSQTILTGTYSYHCPEQLR